MPKLEGPSQKSRQTLLKNLNWGFSMESYAAIHETLMPGPHLDEMNRTLIQNVAASLDGAKHDRVP